MDRAKSEAEDNMDEQVMPVRRRTDRGLPDVGIIFPDAPNEVVTINVWALPMTEAQLAEQPRETFRSPRALIEAGWGQD